MAVDTVRLTNACPVFVSQDVRKTVLFYVDMLGFTSAAHYDTIDRFATVYRDSVELVIVQSKLGKPVSNTARYGAGYDAYIDTDTVGGVDLIYEEIVRKGVTIVSGPGTTDYGTYEFVVQDIDGRLIGIGLVDDKEVYVTSSAMTV